jgi:hypothetical protein
MMDPIATLKAAPDVKQQQTPETASNENAPAEAAPAIVAPPDLTPAKLQVSLDPGAQRFVQVLTDAVTAETVLRYPSETQLAYSRAILAYLRAQNS